MDNWHRLGIAASLTWIASANTISYYHINEHQQWLIQITELKATFSSSALKAFIFGFVLFPAHSILLHKNWLQRNFTTTTMS